MAQAGKISAEARKQFEQKETVRKVNVRNARRYYLIVCEGAKTEPQYFDSLVTDLPQPVANVCRFDIDGVGRSTLSLVDYALKKREELEESHTRNIDSLWVVFDKDSFSANDFNNAIAKCEAANTDGRKVNAGFTNEAFELWYLLHFNFHDTALSRSQYAGKLNEAISAIANLKFEYKKNDPDMYWVLKKYGKQNLAIRYAQKLAKEVWSERTDHANHNPRTQVHELIIELFNLKEELEKEQELSKQ